MRLAEPCGVELDAQLLAGGVGQGELLFVHPVQIQSVVRHEHHGLLVAFEAHPLADDAEPGVALVLCPSLLGDEPCYLAIPGISRSILGRNGFDEIPPCQVSGAETRLFFK